MSTAMRAKLQIASVIRHVGNDGGVMAEVVKFNAVAKTTSYDPDGADEDNTYAKFSPQASMEITVANPFLFGKFAPGQRFYVDFSPAEK